MNIERPRIGIVSLGEAGNLGDDLILIAVVDAIMSEWPDAEVSYLSFGQRLEWDGIARGRGLSRTPHPITDRPELPLLRENKRLFRDRDVIVFGGGGLLQTSHSPDRPYEWLSYLPTGRRSPSVVAVGLGLGPLNERWSRRLVRLGSPFDRAWVRDPDSLRVARTQLGWQAEECRDFIDKEFLSTFRATVDGEGSGPGVLGVALRSWPGLDVATAALMIDTLSRQYDCSRVEFFVLESNRGRGIDVDFSRKVADAVRLPADVLPYEGRHLVEFVGRMMTVKAAVSMKLHSSAIWSSASIPLHPIFYAPKISAFFGVPYRGLEISEEVMLPAPEDPRVPRSAAALVEGVRSVFSEAAAGNRFGVMQRLRFQSLRVARAVRRRISARNGSV